MGMYVRQYEIDCCGPLLLFIFFFIRRCVAVELALPESGLPFRIVLEVRIYFALNGGSGTACAGAEVYECVFS